MFGQSVAPWQAGMTDDQRANGPSFACSDPGVRHAVTLYSVDGLVLYVGWGVGHRIRRLQEESAGYQSQLDLAINDHPTVKTSQDNVTRLLREAIQAALVHGSESQNHKDARQALVRARAGLEKSRAEVRRSDTCQRFLQDMRRVRDKLHRLVRSVKYCHGRVSLFTEYQLPDLQVAGIKKASRKFVLIIN